MLLFPCWITYSHKSCNAFIETFLNNLTFLHNSNRSSYMGKHPRYKVQSRQRNKLHRTEWVLLCSLFCSLLSTGRQPALLETRWPRMWEELKTELPMSPAVRSPQSQSRKGEKHIQLQPHPAEQPGTERPTQHGHSIVTSTGWVSEAWSLNCSCSRANSSVCR